MQFADIAPLITAATGVCTLLLSLFIAVQAMKIHTKTDELVVHTNSLTDKLMAKTDFLARSEGMKEGLAQATTLGSDQAAALAKTTAEAAAMIIQVAADQAAKVLAQAVVDAKKGA